VSDGSGTVTVGPILVQNLPAGGAVLLRGLTVKHTTAASLEPGLTVQGSAGQVWVEDCTLVGKNGFFTIGAMPASPGAAVFNSAHTSFIRSTLTGGIGVDSFFPYAPTPGPGGHGALVSNSGASFWDCTLTGGPGGDFVGFDGDPGPGGVGGHSLSGTGAAVQVSGGTLVGGPGGDGDELVPSPGFYRGGDAVELLGASALRTLAPQLLPGTGGLDGNGQPGPAGLAIDVPAGSVVEYAGSYRGFRVGAPTPEGGVVQVEYTGEPGDLVGIYVSLTSTAFALPKGKGTWMLGSPVLGPFLFGVDGSGALQLSVNVPSVGLGREDALRLLEQAYIADAGGGLFLASPSVHMIVDGSL
jgi:hypothetical protein